MANKTVSEIDPREYERASRMWHNFTKAVKWCVITTVIILVLMAVFLL